jgi:hypothetical protein
MQRNSSQLVCHKFQSTCEERSLAIFANSKMFRSEVLFKKNKELNVVHNYIMHTCLQDEEPDSTFIMPLFSEHPPKDTSFVPQDRNIK